MAAGGKKPGSVHAECQTRPEGDCRWQAFSSSQAAPVGGSSKGNCRSPSTNCRPFPPAHACPVSTLPKRQGGGSRILPSIYQEFHGSNGCTSFCRHGIDPGRVAGSSWGNRK